eukprot:c18148_g1_i1 orf=305-1000(-)
MAGRRPSKRPRAGDSGPALLPPLIVFAHGAGAPSTSEWMLRWKKLLAEATGAVEVVTFDYPYCAGGKRSAPPKAERLVDPHVEEIKRALAKYAGHPLVLIGKSMGSRVSCMVAGRKDIEVAAVVCLGYPLKGVNGTLRADTLIGLPVPVMFVQGTKDALCPLDKLKDVKKKMAVATELHLIDGGDHSFKVNKKALKEHGLTQAEVEQNAVESIQAFLMKVLNSAIQKHRDN